MKKFIILAFVCFFAMLFLANSEIIQVDKYYTTNSPYGGKWQAMYYDQWGGFNEQCRPTGTECRLWSWHAHYEIVTASIGGGYTDPCPQNNNEAYGTMLIYMYGGTSVPPDLEVEFELVESY